MKTYGRALKKPSPKSFIVASIIDALRDEGFEVTPEYRFSSTRHRFDVALVGLKVGIEYEGAVFSHGRHTRGLGYVRDCRKYNRATREGWSVFRYTVKDIEETGVESVLSDIRLFLQNKSKK